MTPFKFNSAEKKQESVMAVAGDPFKQVLRTLFSVEDPMVIGHAIPHDISTNNTKQGPKVPTKAMLNMFNTFEDAAAYAQRMNRPLVILEITAVSRVVPQMPRVERIKDKPPLQLKPQAEVKDNPEVKFES